MPSSTIASDLATEPCASTTARDQPEHEQAEIFDRGEFQRQRGQRQAEYGDHHRRDGAGKERGDRGDRQRGAGAALLGHLVAVQAGHDRGGFAGTLTRMAVVEPPYCAP